MATSLTVTSQLSEVGSKALHDLTCSLLDTWDSNNIIQVGDAGKRLRRE